MYASLGKRLLDLGLAATGLVGVGVPLLLLGLVQLLLEGRPVFFRQVRIGQHGRRFQLYKFRTMRPRPAGDSTVTIHGDNRVTALGRWLRRFKLDELPQLWNVLRGDMSFVGPRPDVPGYADRLRGEEARLLELRPGITGLASLVFRDEEELLARADHPQQFNDEVLYPAKVRLNLEYMDRMCLREDLRLIFLTLCPARLSHPERTRVERMLGHGA